MLGTGSPPRRLDRDARRGRQPATGARASDVVQPVGISVSGYPMEHLREKLSRAGVLDSLQLEKLQGGESIVTAGLVTIRQQPQSAKGTVFLLMEDEFGFINVIVSKKLVERYSEVVKFSTFVAVQGKFERDGNVRNVIGKNFRELKVRQLVHASRDFH
ncbi:MAG: hypothetical protein PVSMB1_01150 [Gemmatimonadaceae bacterium]